tara:strand:- start:704 stop:1690 length:987 start_codon:yes stop_codon:yes gene_type:complete
MLTKGEKPLLFLTLIALISVNVYISCKIVPTKEGFVKKIIKSVTDVFTKKIPEFLVNFLIKKPIKAIPHKGLKEFFLDEVVFDKGLPRAIMSLMWAFIVAIFIILVMVPVITFMMIPFVISVMKLLMIQGIKGFLRLFHVNTSSKMMNMVKQTFKKEKENGDSKKNNKFMNINLPNIETSGENPYEKNIKNMGNYVNFPKNQEDIPELKATLMPELPKNQGDIPELPKNKEETPKLPEHQTNPMEYYKKLSKDPKMKNGMSEAQMFNEMRKHYKKTLPKKSNMAKYSPYLKTMGSSGAKDVFKMGASAGNTLSSVGEFASGVSRLVGM